MDASDQEDKLEQDSSEQSQEFSSNFTGLEQEGFEFTDDESDKVDYSDI